MSHEKRLFLAIMISMGVVFAFQTFFPPPKPATRPTSLARQSADTTSTARVTESLILDMGLDTDPRPSLSALPADTSTPARVISLYPAKRSVTLSESGAVLTGFELKDYLTTRENGTQSPVQLISPLLNGPGCFSIMLDPEDRSRITTSRWAGETYAENPNAISFSTRPHLAELPPDIELAKHFSWDTGRGMGFVFSARNLSDREVTLATGRLAESVGSKATGKTREGSFLLHLGPGLGPNDADHRFKDQYVVHGSYSQAGKVDIAVTSLSWWHSLFGAPEPLHDIDWISIENRYFTIALIPDGFKLDPIFTESPSDGLRCWILLPSFKLAPGESREFKFHVFAGPKSTHELYAFSPEIEKLDGMEPTILPKKVSIARIMVSVLTWINGFVHNWGWSIILLTVLVRLLLYPLSHVQFKSMAKMQNLKPRIEELQLKYAHDKERLQRELMKVYSEAGVNPLGGCLPIIVQMPILIGLFLALQSSIQLRGVPFVLWINDLSIPDTIVTILGLPLNPLPFLMCGTMWFQQKITPMPTADPAQKQMMMIMPFMMTVLFYNFPSGLSLYWVIQNILSIAQQYLMLRQREVKDHGKAGA